MIRNLKALGLALVAVLALGAAAASTASAADDHFTTTQPSALLTGKNEHLGGFFPKFSIAGGGASFECTTGIYTGTVLNNATVATIDPTYTGEINETPHNTLHRCTGSLGDVTIDMNGCHYDLTGNTTGHDENKVDATVWITCPEGKKIQITSHAGVTISVPAQTPTTGGVTYTNLPNHPGGAAVTVKATATGITWECSPALACAFGGLSTHGNDGVYTDRVEATGYEDKSATVPLTPIKEGKQIPIEVSST